jgi:anti-anti-sigma factor
VDVSACRCAPFTIRIHEARGTTVVAPEGEIDLRNRDALRIELEALDGDVVIDLSAVELLDAGAIGVMVEARNRLRDHGGSLVVSAPRRGVRRALEIVELGDWITD